MAVGFLLDVFRAHRDDEAIATGERSIPFRELLEAIARAGRQAEDAAIGPGAIVSLEADYSPEGVAWFLALLHAGAVVVPISPASVSQTSTLLELAEAEWRAILLPDGTVRLESTGRQAGHPLYGQVRRAGHPGLVLFTSGSTGAPKAVLHDASRLLGKYRRRGKRLRTLLFLLFDHIGGVDTLLQALSNACAVIVAEDRSPEGVCATIARHRAEVLPVSPSFLTMLLLSDAHRRHDLSSLRYITYGAEVMPGPTLSRVAAAFPGVTLLQKYGITEIGTLRSRSRANDSLLVRVGGEGFATRVVDGILQVKADSSMIGYLNAPSPFTEDGWFVTGDAVEVQGEYLRILGRASDLINVGGRKVYPAEVEAVLLDAENVAEAAVSGERHPFTGQIVVARVVLHRPEDPVAAEGRIRKHCRGRLEPYQVPMKVEVVAGVLHDPRQKITRR